MDEEFLDLINDRRLKALDNELVAQYTKLHEAWLEARGNRERHQAYISAAKTLSDSPWRTLLNFIDRLPLVSVFELAPRNSEIRERFLERLRAADTRDRKELQAVKQSIRSFISALSDDIPGRLASPGNTRTPEPETVGIPHPLLTILKRSTRSGGPHGAQRLANELDDYCTQQLLAYTKWNQRTKKKPSSRSQSGHVGKLNAIGVLTTLFTPRTAHARLQAATEAIEDGQTHRVFLITHKEIENFLNKQRIESCLARLK